MVIKDEETLEEAILLVEQGPIRYSDLYAFVIITNSETLIRTAGSALNRGDIAIVAPLGQEKQMEDHTTELRKVKEQRRKQELKDVREYFREHPERVVKIQMKEEKRGKS